VNCFLGRLDPACGRDDGEDKHLHIIDKLSAAIAEIGNPTCAGLDTRFDYLPEGFAAGFAPFSEGGGPASNRADAIFAFNEKLLHGLRGVVPSVKVQVAYYEMLGVAGMAVFSKTLQLARELGYITIADVKRNDIGATAEAYAEAYFAEGADFAADIITVNGYLGSDGIMPFLKYAPQNGIFVLVKTSNPSSGELQDRKIVAFGNANSDSVYETMGEMVYKWGENHIGECGYSAVGAVVGATYPEQGARLRKLLPHTFFLVPGYGAQGATAADLAGCFDKNGGGAIVNASRSILCAWKKTGKEDFVQAAVDEAVAMREALKACRG